MKKTIILLIGLNLLYGHTLWIDNGFNVHQGHMHQKSLSDAKSMVEDADIQKELCLKEGNVSNTTQRELPAQGCDALFVMLQEAYYTKTPYGTEKLPKNRTKMPIESWQSIESVKRLYRDSKVLAKEGLEIILRNSLLELKVGKKARLTIYFNGEPLQGATIANGHKTIGVSDKNGEVNVKIREEGLQNLKASYTLKGDGEMCDKIIHTTTLNFEVMR